jgi:hypothetical protein
MDRRATQVTNGNCHIAETGAGEGVVVLTLRRVQWMKICRSVEEAARLATALKFIEPNKDLMAHFQTVDQMRTCWCFVPDDYPAAPLLAAGFTYVQAAR